MRKGVRQRASENLKEGFWFPAFQRLINFHYTRLSLGFRFKNWLNVGDEAPRGAAELYQILVILLGAGLLALVSSTNPVPDWLPPPPPPHPPPFLPALLFSFPL